MPPGWPLSATPWVSHARPARRPEPGLRPGPLRRRAQATGTSASAPESRRAVVRGRQGVRAFAAAGVGLAVGHGALRGALLRAGRVRGFAEYSKGRVRLHFATGSGPAATCAQVRSGGAAKGGEGAVHRRPGTDADASGSTRRLALGRG